MANREARPIVWPAICPLSTVPQTINKKSAPGKVLQIILTFCFHPCFPHLYIKGKISSVHLGQIFSSSNECRYIYLARFYVGHVTESAYSFQYFSFNWISNVFSSATINLGWMVNKHIFVYGRLLPNMITCHPFPSVALSASSYKVRSLSSSTIGNH